MCRLRGAALGAGASAKRAGLDDDDGRRLESHRKGARINVATRDGAAKARERCATPARRHRVVGKI